MTSFKAIGSMKKAVALVVVAGVLFWGWRVYARHEARVAEHRVAQAKRDAAYQIVLAQFQRDLQLGMPRSEVKKYLDSKQVSYFEWDWNIQSKIGEDPDPDSFACDRWSVYIDFHFEHGQARPSEFDRLSGIGITRIGHCL
jgi:hypothetical protein